jgi:hypothetical protein
MSNSRVHSDSEITVLSHFQQNFFDFPFWVDVGGKQTKTQIN